MTSWGGSSSMYYEPIQDYPTGSLEWHQQEKIRRIRRLQEEREKYRLRNLIMREIRSQNDELDRQNRQSKATLTAMKPTTAKPTDSKSSITSSNTELKKTKSQGQVPPKPTTSNNKLEGKKSKSSSTLHKAKKESRKSSKSVQPNSSAASTQSKSRLNKKSSKVQQNLASSKKSQNRKFSKAPSERKSTSKIAAKSGSKVTFSSTVVDEAKGKNNAEVTLNPVSILKNRHNMDFLRDTSLGNVQTLPSYIEEAQSAANTSPATSAKTNSNANPDSSKAPVPPAAEPIPFSPGTKEWDDYWKTFSKDMDKFHKEMKTYEYKGTQKFKEDLAAFKKAHEKMKVERELVTKLGPKSVETGLIRPPDYATKTLTGVQMFNGYIMKSNKLKGTVSNIPGQMTGCRFELNLEGISPDNVLIQKDQNLLTISIDYEKYLRIGTPKGKVAGDIEIWPPIGGKIIIDAP